MTDTERFAYTDMEVDHLASRVDTLERNGIPGVRDFFATSALSILANSDGFWRSASERIVAEKCYAIADAMLVERDKKK